MARVFELNVLVPSTVTPVAKVTGTVEQESHRRTRRCLEPQVLGSAAFVASMISPLLMACAAAQAATSGSRGILGLSEQ